MFLSNISVKRPIAMSCLIIGLALMGVNSWKDMSLELMPAMDIPFITIVTIYPGASPKEIETEVAKRIEDAVGKIDGLKNSTSTCMGNVHQILLEFNLGIDVDIAATDVSQELDKILDDLPDAAETPQIEKFDINATPVVTLALTGDAPLEELYDFANNELSDRLTVITGVADVELTGGAEREVQILIDREALGARGLTTTDIVGTVQNALGKIPAGNVRSAGMEFSVKYDADFKRTSAIGDLEIANQNGQRCYLRNVAEVKMGTEELRKTASIDGRSAVAIKVIKKSDANAVKVADGVREALDRLHETMPGGMELVWVSDDATFIRASNSSAWLNVAQGIILTALVLFFFLYNLRALIVVSITMPLTIIIGLFFMDMAGFSLNTATLIAIGMSVGILVTNSIVVLEGIIKRLDKSGDPKAAAKLGASETFIAVLASAGTNIVVLFPLAMMKSKMAQFIGPLALTMLIMTAVSLFISFTLTPMLCALLLKPRKGEQRGLLGRMETGWNKGFDWVIGVFRSVLQFNERHRWAAIGVMVLVVAMFAHALSRDVGFGFVADTDRGEFYVKLEYPTQYNIEHTQKAIRMAEEGLKSLPHLEHILTTTGRVQGTIGQASEGVYLAQMLLCFNDRTKRDMTATELLKQIRQLVADLPEPISTATVTSIVGGQSTPVEMEISGEDLPTLDLLAEKSVALARNIDGFEDIDSTVRAGKPELRITPKRDILSDLRMSARGLGLTLRGNIEGLEAGNFTRGDRNYDIIVKFKEQPGRKQIAAYQMPGEPGHPVRLDNFADIKSGSAPIQIIRKNKQRIAKIYATLDENLPLGTAVDKLSQAVDQEADLPPGYQYTFSGLYETMAEANAGFSEALLIAVVLVILTLAAILESFKQPWLILITIPLALIGVMWALALAGMDLDMFAIMGIVMMIGIVVNNAILIMDQFNVHVAEGVPKHKAMITATCERFRPIIMITIAAVLGMLPLALGQGIGAEMRNGVGMASAGGILVSGILTLFVLPILYDLFTRKRTNKASVQTMTEKNEINETE